MTILYLTLNVPGTKREVILHPPHLMDSDGTLMPGAFIPICAYQGNLLGVTSPELNFTACDLFEPTLVQNQLCYSLNLTKTKNWTTKENNGNALILVIDQEASMTLEREGEESIDHDSGSFGKLFIDTLSHFHDVRSGTYVLSSLKQLMGTTQFLELTDKEKECQIEPFEECQRRNLLKKITQQCHCVPWLMSNGFKVIVITVR